MTASVILRDGPWTHRDVAANGARFHIAEVGDGPLVLLLHGFPQFWWAWRHQLTALADAGFRAVAMDLRGVGGSDRTPRGYDPPNLALDITGVIRSLGEPDAALVGHDLGGYLAWTAAVMRPKLVRRLAVASMPHPRVWRSALLTDPRQTVASGAVWRFQSPWLPERRLVADGPLGEPLSPTCPTLGAEIVHAMREEAALTLADAILRRTEAGVTGHPGRAALERAAAIMAFVSAMSR